ncbi:hypothetical protein V6Z11_D09G257800 [Gossypium hirsutum]
MQVCGQFTNRDEIARQIWYKENIFKCNLFIENNSAMSLYFAQGTISRFDSFTKGMEKIVKQCLVTSHMIRSTRIEDPIRIQLGGEKCSRRKVTFWIFYDQITFTRPLTRRI